MFDAKTLEVRSADLGVNYDGQLAILAKELTEMRNVDGRVTRALKALGVTAARPMKEADLKKVAAAPNAAELIKDLEKADLEVSLTPMAWDSAHANMDKAEKAAREILFEQMDQVDSRPHESDRQGDRGAQQGTETAGQPAG